MKKEQEYKKPHIASILEAVSAKFNLDPVAVKSFALEAFPELTDKAHCGNCGANMKIDLYSPDVIDGLLLLKMAEAVRENVKKGIPFTDANMVHVPTLQTTDAIRHRTTRCSYLNYIKQPDKVRQSGNWLITHWGWQLLAGKPVPKYVKYFRGHLIERGDETVTLAEIFSTHNEKVAQAIANRKTPKSDQRHIISTYRVTDWVEFGGYADGNIKMF